MRMTRSGRPARARAPTVIPRLQIAHHDADAEDEHQRIHAKEEDADAEHPIGAWFTLFEKASCQGSTADQKDQAGHRP